MQFYDFEQGIRDNLVGDRMMAMLSGFFGVLAALLVVVGLVRSAVLFPCAAARARSEFASRWGQAAAASSAICFVTRQ